MANIGALDQFHQTKAVAGVGRREFIAFVGATAAAWPLAARAQQSDRVRRIGVLIGIAESDPEAQTRAAAFQEGLRKLGWVEGRNIRIDYRWAGGNADRIRAYAAELAAMKPDVIFCAGTQVLEALQQATRTVPIVFAQVTDPVATGFVASLARPGGNITGFALYETSIGTKWLELLKEIAPRVARVAVIYASAMPTSARFLREIEAATPAFRMQLTPADISDAAAIERAIDSLTREPNGGLIVLPGPTTSFHRETIISLAAKHRLPAVYPYRYFVTSGGLASYGTDNHDLYRRAASYVDRILKGAKPADLPVQQADKFELVINLKTAKALGLDPPLSLLMRVNEVIE